ncbi:MFS transporter [Aquimarina sp. 2201CG14-23]|uniref:MFS transporter n=1 Tax=Aquimarina mycalae TaxID=3040073 RepID=UPI002477D335|nr:MFS transporter [Aquimarina sp. 2201CG14-23]MDH7445031.1 MFS transporter [Aquimarina sp. 2201CG14-23]
MNSLCLIISKLRYFGPAWVFASLNIMTGTWVLYIPKIKSKLLIDDAQLGIALFCFALGTLVMIPLSSIIIGRFGVGKITSIGITLFSLAFLMPLIAQNYMMLCIVLFVVGLFACLTDVAMNALVSEIEQEDTVHIMSASHGFFSLGGVIGAGVGSFLITYFNIPLVHMLCAAIFVIVSNIMVCKGYINIKGKKEDRSKKSFDATLIKPLLGLTVIAFLIMGSEGAIEHWSKLYMQDVVMISSEKISGFGFVAFSIMMTLGRFFGDSVSKHFGSLVIIISGCLISIFGFIAVLASGLIITIIGFGFVGLGFSVIIPELFRLAGKTQGISSAEGISFVAGFGYLGFLISPPFLGFLSKIDSLKLSFTALLLATIVALLVTFVISKKRSK